MEVFTVLLFHAILEYLLVFVQLNTKFHWQLVGPCKVQFCSQLQHLFYLSMWRSAESSIVISVVLIRLDWAG
jgi:hypothetical protein